MNAEPEPGAAARRAPAATDPPGRSAGWARALPGLQALLQAPRRGWGHDLVAGLVLTAVLVPVGVAYAVAAGVPAISGLYATVFGLLAYAVFGPSRVLVLGPDSSLVALILGVVLPLSAGDPQRALALAGMMALVSSALCVLAGLARLGFVTELLSKPIRHGYMNGIALTVLVSQLPALFGLSPGGSGLLGDARGWLQAVQAGQTNVAALAIGAGTLALILLLRRWPRLPGVLLAVVAATALAAGLDLAGQHGVQVLGILPRGLPALGWPGIGRGDLVPVLLGGLAVALVSFADTSVLARTYAVRAGRPTDPNQEMIALGAANLAAGLSQGIPISASASRTPVAWMAGARTPWAGVVGALAVAALLVWAPGLLAGLPTPALAAVVIASAIGLFEVAELRRLYRIQRWEFWLAVVCLVGVAVLGAIAGIGLAIAIAVVEFVWQAWRPHSAVLGRVDGLKGYHDTARYPQARTVPGLLLFRWDAPLFFANAELFRDRVQVAVAASATPVRWLVVEGSSRAPAGRNPVTGPAPGQPLWDSAMNEVMSLAFGQPDLHIGLDGLSDEQLDGLDFGVIGFTADTVVCRYNAFESKCAGLSAGRVLGHGLFTAVAPCMNNFLVAQRFEDAAANGTVLDATIDYVLTLRMRPVKVQLRLLSAPGHALRYVVLNRTA